MKTRNRLIMIAAVIFFGALQAGQCFYNPTRGTWLSRDPMQEVGGRNLYTFVCNNSVNKMDRLGLTLLSYPAEVLGEVTIRLEEGISIAQIAADYGLSVEEVTQIAAQISGLKIIEEIVKNVEGNAKGKNPCEKAQDALRQLQKGIQNTLDTIKQHEDWVSNPNSYPGGLQPPFDQHPEWAVATWLKQIANQKTNLERLNAAVKVLQKAVDIACRCWYKPWTW